MSLQSPQQPILENFIIVWLDSNINEFDTDFQYSINQLRCVANLIKTFVDPDQCIDYMADVKNEKVFMIVSNALGQQLVPLIEDIPQLYAIYVFCVHKTMHEQWIKDYHKVKGVFTQIKPLCDILKRDVHRADIDLTPISIVSASSVIDSNQLDQSFMYSQLLKEILLKMKYDENAKTEFIEFCLIQYVENESALHVIDEFERDYDPTSPIWWYTRDCFIYSMLNKALRTQDIEIIIKIGFFIRDLHQQIEHLHSQSTDPSPFIVYRGQGMLNAEFEKMSKSEGDLLSFNNFLSTSIDREVSFAFADSARQNPELTGVLFRIEIDPSVSTAPFASLDNLSYFEDSEEEILFSMHTVFRIGEINQIENRMWEVKLTLTSDSDEQLKCLTDYMRKEIETVGTEEVQLGYLIYKLGKLNKAEEVFKAILESPTSNNLIANSLLHNYLGMVMSRKGDQSTALSHLKKALEVREKTLSPNHLQLATVHSDIGQVHWSMGEYSSALLHYKKEHEIRQKSLPPDHPDFATLHSNISLVHLSMGEYSAALPHLETAIEIQQKSLPPNHPNLAISHNNIGSLLQLMGQYSTALTHYEKALETQEKSLPPNHPDIVLSHNNIGEVCRSMGEYSLALSHYEKALEIRQKSIVSNPLELAASHNNIGMLHQSMGKYSAALLHLEKALEIWRKSLPPNHPNLAISYNNIGLVHQIMREYSTALPHYEKAFEIRKKCRPPNYPELAESHNNIGMLHQSMGKYSAALSHLEKALEIWRKSLPSNHPNIATVHNNIAIVYHSLDRYEDAIQHAFEAIDIGSRAFGSDHPQMQLLRDSLQNLLSGKQCTVYFK